MQIVSNTEQKIFPFHSEWDDVAYVSTGIASIGEFQLMPAIEKQIKTDMGMQTKYSPTLSEF